MKITAEIPFAPAQNSRNRILAKAPDALFIIYKSGFSSFYAFMHKLNVDFSQRQITVLIHGVQSKFRRKNYLQPKVFW